MYRKYDFYELFVHDVTKCSTYMDYEMYEITFPSPLLPEERYIQPATTSWPSSGYSKLMALLGFEYN